MSKSTHRKTLSKLQNIPAHLQWNPDRIANESLSVATISHQRLETPTSSTVGTSGSPQQIQTPIAHIDYFDIKTSQYALWGQDDGVPTSKGKETGGSRVDSVSLRKLSMILRDYMICPRRGFRRYLRYPTYSIEIWTLTRWIRCLKLR